MSDSILKAVRQVHKGANPENAFVVEDKSELQEMSLSFLNDQGPDDIVLPCGMTDLGCQLGAVIGPCKHMRGLLARLVRVSAERSPAWNVLLMSSSSRRADRTLDGTLIAGRLIWMRRNQI